MKETRFDHCRDDRHPESVQPTYTFSEGARSEDEPVDLSKESRDSERECPRDQSISLSEQVKREFDEAQSWGAGLDELAEGTHQISDTLNPRTTATDSREVARHVARATGMITGEGQDIHHIVPISETDGQGLLDEVRDRLSSEGINVGTDSSNLVALPSRSVEGRVNNALTIHQDVHDHIESYAEQLHGRIAGAPPGEARAALETFKSDLQEGRIMLCESKSRIANDRES